MRQPTITDLAYMSFPKLSDQIRFAIRLSGATPYGVAMAAGINPGSLTRFLRGGGLSITALDRLCEHLEFVGTLYLWPSLMLAPTVPELSGLRLSLPAAAAERWRPPVGGVRWIEGGHNEAALGNP